MEDGKGAGQLSTRECCLCTVDAKWVLFSVRDSRGSLTTPREGLLWSQPVELFEGCAKKR